MSRQGTHAINYVESADVHLEVQGGKEKSRTSDLIKSLGARMRNGREKSAVPAERRKSSIRRASRNDSPSRKSESATRSLLRFHVFSRLALKERTAN